MGTWKTIQRVAAWTLCAGLIGSCAYLTINDDIESGKVATQLERVKEISGIAANKDNDNYFSLDEKLSMWKDMGWYMEEYITNSGQKEYKVVKPGYPNDAQSKERNQWEIDRYEQYLIENEYEFTYTPKEGYTFTQTPEKSGLRK